MRCVDVRMPGARPQAAATNNIADFIFQPATHDHLPLPVNSLQVVFVSRLTLDLDL